MEIQEGVEVKIEKIVNDIYNPKMTKSITITRKIYGVHLSYTDNIPANFAEHESNRRQFIHTSTPPQLSHESTRTVQCVHTHTHNIFTIW